MVKQRITGDKWVLEHCSDTSHWLPERFDHVNSVERSAYKARRQPGVVTIRNGQVCGKYMATLWSTVFRC
jgi:hypothetical protein